MFWKERVMGWWVVVVVMVGSALPVAGQEGGQDPAQVRAIEIFQEVAKNGEFASDLDLTTAWIDALEAEFGIESPVLSAILHGYGMGLYKSGKYHESLIFFEQQHRILLATLGPEAHATLTAQGNLANLAGVVGDLERAKALQKEVVAARNRILGEEHPDTLTGKANLAGTLRALGDLTDARQHEEEVLLVLVRVLGEEHPNTLVVKGNLAGTLYELGDLAGARQHLEEVLAVHTRILGKEHPRTLSTKSNLAATLRAQGDLASARRFGEEVFAVGRRTLGEEHPKTLTYKGALAATLRTLGDFAGARQHLEEVLEAQSRILGEEHPQTLTSKGSLATILYLLDDLVGARQRQEDLLAARSRILGEEHLATLVTKGNLAATLQALGDLVGSREHNEEALAVLDRILGEDHPRTLGTKAVLGGTLYELGDLAGARKCFEELIQARAELLGPNRDPSTYEEASHFFWLARVLRRLGDLGGAIETYLEGLDALEAQILRVDFSEDGRSRFREQNAVAYGETVSTELERDRPDNAFLLLERYRTQSLMNLLRWSRSESGAEIPEEWRIELAEIAQRYDGITRRIDKLYPERDPALDAEQARLRRRREVIQGQVIDLRREAEGVPEASDFEALRASLDPGTVLLAYSIGSNESHLFVLSQEHGVEVHPIASEASQLWTQVGRLRANDLEGFLADKDEDNGESREALAQWLFDKLLSPAADRIDAAERVLVLPDGPLYYLPFSALTRSVAPTRGDPRGWQYLAEWKPFHTVQSVTVYAELQARRPEPSDSKRPTWQWVGFGDPYYPSPQTAEASEPAPTAEGSNGQQTDAPWSVLRSTTDRGIWDGLTTLPHTQREIEEIQAQFPDSQAKAFLDRDATEDEARKLLGTTRIAHFAAHGLADPGYPLDSFLALSLFKDDEAKGRDLEHNGLLQAWEIIDHLQLDADLVVLSACVTAFGPERGGEGLISLSRAFQIAGARSVLASLWAVNDQSTSELMIRFYRNLLEKGMTKDVALQQAQIELIRGPIETVDPDGNPTTRDFSAPYHWAAFQLIGDWL